MYLTYIFRCNKLSELFIIILLTQAAILISIYFHIDFFYDLFEYLIVNIQEELVEFLETNKILVFLQEPDDISLCASLDKVLILSALWVVNFQFGFFLAHYIQFRQFTNNNGIIL